MQKIVDTKYNEESNRVHKPRKIQKLTTGITYCINNAQRIL